MSRLILIVAVLLAGCSIPAMTGAEVRAAFDKCERLGGIAEIDRPGGRFAATTGGIYAITCHLPVGQRIVFRAGQS